MADAPLLPGIAGLATLSPAPPLARLILRARPEAEARAGAAFGSALPERINRAATKGERGQPGARAALRLGPDEFLLILPLSEREAMIGTIARALADDAHALVDVSDRSLGYLIAGRGVALVLNAGVPLDLDLAAFPVGMATRTVYLKAEILLWRVAEDAFRIEIARSFAPYFLAMIEQALRDAK
jgi:sarcosine oxidase subunit gamma